MIRVAYVTPKTNEKTEPNGPPWSDDSDRCSGDEPEYSSSEEEDDAPGVSPIKRHQLMTKNKDSIEGIMERSGAVNRTQLSLEVLENQIKELEAKLDSQQGSTIEEAVAQFKNRLQEKYAQAEKKRN